MSSLRPQQREFLFLQGPPGPFFRLLGHELRRRGIGVHRINLCGGDRYDWQDEAIDFRGRRSSWPLFFDSFTRDKGITDLVLYGDCRPLHEMAIGMARLRGIAIHVFEEGYIRPDWMTLELGGVNGNSTFARDPEHILSAARDLPPVPKLPAIGATFHRRARDSYWHYHHVVLGRLRFPFYRTHRRGSLIIEGLGWLLRFAKAARRSRQAQEALRAIHGRKYFLFTLQLAGDYQIRKHSPFGSMRIAIDYVLRSFAETAPEDAVLLVKEHPLNSSFRDWRSYLRRQARRLGISGRVIHIDGGDLAELCEDSSGVVCVNSTSGTLALEVGKPVIVLGSAVYNLAGVTHQAGLDSFWSAPELPDPALYEAFKRKLHATCLVRGGLASESGLNILLANSVERLLTGQRVRNVRPSLRIAEPGLRRSNSLVAAAP